MKDSRGMGIDLMAIDIQRARDHGVPPYHSFITMCTNSRYEINTWLDLSTFFPPNILSLLAKIYDHPRDVDLFVGILFETRSSDQLVGQIGRCILAEQFRRFKFGDRFFYQWIDGPNPFTHREFP